MRRKSGIHKIAYKDCDQVYSGQIKNQLKLDRYDKDGAHFRHGRVESSATSY